MGNVFSIDCPCRVSSSCCGKKQSTADDDFEDPNDGHEAQWTELKIPCDQYWRVLTETLSDIWPVIFSYALESYELTLYGLAINAIKFNFFANSTEAAWVCYAVPYLTRPIGGMAGGWLSDRYGRRIVVISAAYAMLFTTVAQGLIPGGSGVYGLATLVVLRLLQGLSYGSTASITVYTAEVVPKDRLGMGMMFLVIGKGLGGLLCTLAFAVVEEALDTASMYAWGWRIPYLLVFLPGIISAVASHDLQESPDYEAGQAEGLSFRDLVVSMATDYPLYVLLHVGLAMAYATTSIIAVSYLVEWLHDYTGIAEATATWLALLNCFVTIAASPCAAYLTDTLGPSRILLVGYGSLTVLTIPLFALTLYGPNLYASAVVLSIVFGASNALGTPVTLMAVGLFPQEVRAVSFGLLHNIEQCLFNGLSPALVTWLCEYGAMAPAFYLFGIEVLTVAAIVGIVTAHFRGTKMASLRDVPF